MEEKSDLIVQLVFFFFLIMGISFSFWIINHNKLNINKNSMLVISSSSSSFLILYSFLIFQYDLCYIYFRIFWWEEEGRH